MVKKKERALAEKNPEKLGDTVPSLLELYLTSSNLDYKDVVGMAVDLLLAGIDTVSDLCYSNMNLSIHCLTFTQYFYKICFRPHTQLPLLYITWQEMREYKIFLDWRHKTL